jgi:hypothetical protein
MSHDYLAWRTRLSTLPRRSSAAARASVKDVRRPAKVAVALANAHLIPSVIDDGRCDSGADVARVLGRSRNRISQLRALACLAPDIQEEILELEAIHGVEPVTEKWVLRHVARAIDWNEQRAAWRARVDVIGA